uniref:D-alanyl-D-alanine carboxypeptidase n=1 Tax=Thermodesulfobacterium geofontis TaxID=1295609 RepID=A0A7V5XHC0_9BACT
MKKMKKLLFIFIVFFLFLIFVNFNLCKATTYDVYPEINAICAVAIDGKTGKILYAKNPHLKFPPASTAKLVTAMVVLDHLSLSEKIKISKNAEQIPSASPKLYEDEVYTVKDLLYLMLMKSSNQAAVALAEAVAGSEENFSMFMNRKVYSLGLKNSHFVTASGLPAPNQYTTPYELAIIFYEALKYPLIKEIISTPVKIITSETGRTLIIKNTNKLLDNSESEINIIGGKTGFTRASKHCLVNGAYVEDKLIITSVLGSPNRESLWQDSKNLINFAKMVLDHKISPIYITTVVNTGVLVNRNFKNSQSKIYKKSKSGYNKYTKKKGSKKMLVKKKGSKKVLVKSKKSSIAKNIKIKNTRS